MKMESLPEGCVSHILSLTTPRDVCRFSSVSTTFLSASESDDVWIKFLPSDLHQHRSDASKKNLYLRLCDSHILIDGGKKRVYSFSPFAQVRTGENYSFDKSFSLDKSSGKKCYMIAARDLAISWGDDLSYWKWISLPQSRFSEVAMLRMVCWLEIRGKIRIDMLSRGTKYVAYLVFKLTTNPHAFGFGHLPVETSVCISGNDSTSTRIVDMDPSGIVHHFDPDGLREEFPENPPVCGGEVDDRHPKQRKDGWMEIELGEYITEGGGEDDEELEMSVMEIKEGNTKSGLLVHGIEIRPKHAVSL